MLEAKRLRIPKMKKFYLFSLVAMLVLGLTSCKYEEGPAIAFTSKLKRVSNTWVVNQAEINGASSTSISGFKEITFFENGDCQIVYTPFGVDYPYSGTWTFTTDKSAIRINTTDDGTGLLSYANDWTILMLKEDALKVTYSQSAGGGTDSYIVTFEPGI